MKIFKRVIIGMIVLLMITGGLVFYAFRIEPYMLHVNEISLNEKNEDKSLMKVIQISDIHIKEDFTYENLEKVVNKVNALNPDVVIFTGDLYDDYSIYHDDENVSRVLGEIQAKYMKVATWGNRDVGGGASKVYQNLMEDAGFEVLQNTDITIQLENKKILGITGLDDYLLGHQELPQHRTTSDYQILLTHEPDIADIYTEEGYDIILSGHSHGGQVRIPFVHMITTAMGEKYTGGMYTLKNDQQLYVNTGIGTTHISARFGVVPEITEFSIYI